MAIASIANNNPESPAREVSVSQAMPVLRQLASSGGTVDIQRSALRAIGRVGSPEDVETIKQIGAANRTLQSSVEGAIQEIERRAEGGPGYRSRWFRAW
jgi:hypothetical protein